MRNRMEKFTKCIEYCKFSQHFTKFNSPSWSVIDEMEVVEILSTTFFIGLASSNVTTNWSQLHQIISRNNVRRRNRLQNQKGILLFNQTINSGKQYVVDQLKEKQWYGDVGKPMFWRDMVVTKRWKTYCRKHIKQHFQYSILEIAMVNHLTNIFLKEKFGGSRHYWRELLDTIWN